MTVGLGVSNTPNHRKEAAMSAHTMDHSSGATAVRETAVLVDSSSHVHRRVSWGAALAGVALAVSIQLVLSMLGAAIGLGILDPNEGTTPDASTLGIGAGIWWVISSIIALGVGGYVAAWLAGVEIAFDGLLHGLLTWAIATLFTFYLLTSAVGSLIGGGFSALGSVASTAGEGIKAAAPQVARATGVTPEMLQDQARRYLQPTNPDPATMSDEDAQKEVARNLAIYVKGGPEAAGAKDRVVTIMAARLNVSKDEATQRFNQAEAQLNQSKDQVVQTARQAADTGAAGASTASWMGFIVLLLGAVAAAVGGAMAVQRRTLAATTHTVR
jgi:hypothetical protein